MENKLRLIASRGANDAQTVDSDLSTSVAGNNGAPAWRLHPLISFQLGKYMSLIALR